MECMRNSGVSSSGVAGHGGITPLPSPAASFPPCDLRQVLREKAASHRSFYERLESKNPAPVSPADQSAVDSAGGMSAGLLRPPKKLSQTNSSSTSSELLSSDDDDSSKRPDRPKSRDSAVDLDESPNISNLKIDNMLIHTSTPNEEDEIKDGITTNNKACPEIPGYDSGGENAFDESSPYDKRSYCEEHCCYHIRSKMILEAQYVEYPFLERKCSFEEESGETDLFSGDANSSAARRPSALSWDGDEIGRVRVVRTPSVVVSDYSDDIHAGITAEELEYFRKHVEAASPSSGRSSCSNLDSRCGSQLSVLDVDENTACGSLLSVADLDDGKNDLSPSVSDCEDDDSGLGQQHSTRKIISPH